MLVLSELVDECAQLRIDRAPTLSFFARKLREAGRVSKGGRGRGGAKMTFIDGARFLIACASTESPDQVAKIEEIFSSAMVLFESVGAASSGLLIRKTDTLDQGLARLLEHIGAAKYADSGLRSGPVTHALNKEDLSAVCSLHIDRSACKASIFFESHVVVFRPTEDIASAYLKTYGSGKRIRAELEGSVLQRIGQRLQTKQ